MSPGLVPTRNRRRCAAASTAGYAARSRLLASAAVPARAKAINVDVATHRTLSLRRELTRSTRWALPPGKSTNLGKRVDALLLAIAGRSLQDDPSLGALRYQLFSAVAGRSEDPPPQEDVCNQNLRHTYPGSVLDEPMAPERALGGGWLRRHEPSFVINNNNERGHGNPRASTKRRRVGRAASSTALTLAATERLADARAPIGGYRRAATTLAARRCLRRSPRGDERSNELCSPTIMASGDRSKRSMTRLDGHATRFWVRQMRRRAR